MSPQNPQHYHIGTRSRTSGSSRAAASAELELQFARAKEARILAAINALDAGSSRASSEIDSITGRLSLAGLGPAAATRHAAPQHNQGAAHSPKPPEGDGVDASESMHDRHTNSQEMHIPPEANSHFGAKSRATSSPQLPPAGTGTTIRHCHK